MNLRIMNEMFLLLVLNWTIIVHSAKPIARNLVYHVKPGEEVLITLAGYDLDGDKLVAKITSLPDSGMVHQLSQVFSKHGYDPKKHSSPIKSTPEIVTGSKNRIVYARPALDSYAKNGKYTEFKYTVSDSTLTSNEGVVYITNDEISMKSNFDLGSEDWAIINNGDSKVTYEASRRGALNYYIYGIENLIQTSNDGNDLKLWYFSAPSKFLGNHWDAYGGQLGFTLSAASGDFSSGMLNTNGKDLVVLECNSCATNTGIKLVRRLDSSLTFDGETKTFSIKLDETAGWLKDPKSTIKQWTTPTQCEFVEVMSALTSFQILGDFTKLYETISLDSVSFKHGKKQPIACYK